MNKLFNLSIVLIYVCFAILIGDKMYDLVTNPLSKPGNMVFVGNIIYIVTTLILFPLLWFVVNKILERKTWALILYLLWLIAKVFLFFSDDKYKETLFEISFKGGVNLFTNILIFVIGFFLLCHYIKFFNLKLYLMKQEV